MICKNCLGSKKVRDIDYDGTPTGEFLTCPTCKGTGVIYVDPRTVKMVDLVRNNKQVYFSYYRDHEFWYKHEDGLLFPVALSEVDNPASRATLLAKDKAIYFMRWMKKYIEICKKENEKVV